MGLFKKRSVPAKKDPPRFEPELKRLRRAWALGRKGFPVLFSICVAARVPPFFARLAHAVVWPGPGGDAPALSVTLLLIITLYELASAVLGVLALFYAVMELDAGRRVTVYGAYAAAVRRAREGFAAAAWAAVIVTLGLVCLIVPGLIFLTQYSFAGFIVMQDEAAGRAALARSKEIVMRAQAKAAANLALLFLACGGIVLSVSVPLGFVMGFLFGILDFGEDSLLMALSLDLSGRIAAQIPAVAAAAYWWIYYKEAAGGEKDPELIML